MRRHIPHRTRASIVINVTPMIDVVFLLIIFFVLVSRFADAELVAVDLPDPESSQARAMKITDRVILNIQLSESKPESSADVEYRLGPNPPEPPAVIAERLALHKQFNPEVKVIIRADRRVRYRRVREIMEMIAENGIEMLSIAAYVGDPGTAP